jgi:peroxiredoxin/uncharacterized membrane protein YphA (DoxX/SURF4 family)
MDSLVVGAQILLAAVFAVAGIAKLRDLAGSRQAVAEFGVPARLAPSIGTALPIAELVAAVLLIIHPTARWGALVALLLLVSFVIGIATAMSRGRAPDCNCFGQLHSAPAGRSTLARNVVLAALASVVVVHGPGPAINTWIAARSAAELVAIIAVIAALALAALAWHQRGRYRDLRAAYLRASSQIKPELIPEGLPAGVPAPRFALKDERRETTTLEGLLGRGLPVALFFVETDCAACTRLLPRLAEWQTTLADRVTIAVLTPQTDRKTAALWRKHGLRTVLQDPSRETFYAYSVRGTPNSVLIDPQGTVAGGPAGGLHMPEVLLRVALRRSAAENWPTQPAPRFEVLEVGPRAA